MATEPANGWRLEVIAIDKRRQLAESCCRSTRNCGSVSVVGGAHTFPLFDIIQENIMIDITLNNGVVIPALGYGVWQIQDETLCAQCVVEAVKAGYRSIDTAAVYLNEIPVGRGIKASGVKREELFITSKLWVQDISYEKAKRAIDHSLRRLQLDYLDLYLQHWPFGDTVGAWKAMEEAHRAGKLRAIGLSNFTIPKIEEILREGSIKPAVNQVECHPVFQQKELSAYLKAQNIQLESWSPLGHAAKEVMENPLLNSLAVQYGKDIAQIILRWHIQEGYVAIPKSIAPQRIRSNFQIWDFELTDDEMEQIRSLDTGRRMFGDPESKEFQKAMTARVLDI
jgi:diketogulonate reductase-like aldo/keto reductase